MSVRPLVFELVDAHVIAGRADEVAVQRAGRVVSYAELLHDSASLAATLRNLGLVPGGSIQLDPGDVIVEALGVLAALRLGVQTAPRSPWQVRADPDRVMWPDGDLDLAEAIGLGRVDPLPCPGADPPGFAEAMTRRHSQLFEALRSGAGHRSA